MSKLTAGLSLGVLTLFCLYLPINVGQVRLYNFKTVFDDHIPLITVFVIPYISYFLFLVFTFLYFLKKAEIKMLNVVLMAVIISCLAAYFVYLFFQNYIERPEIVMNNIFDETYRIINIWVAPFNAFPSLHVAISTVCGLGFWRIKAKLFKLIFFWAGLIIISTVLTKQHYFLDVAGGLVLGLTSFKLAEIILRRGYKI